jgi:hypothetical protein
MIRPIINNNGTNALDLIDGRRNAMDLIDEVIDTLKQLTPNGRDYLGDRDRLIADRELHFDRLAALHTLREELLDEALHIQQQGRVGA